MRLKDGATLQNGKYRIIRLLGQGGFGITYLAEHTMLDKLVAIKEFFPKEYCDRDTTTSNLSIGTKNSIDIVEMLKVKFIKEARNISKLNHPNIITIHDIFQENETAYYVMEYIEGSSLSEIIKKDGAIAEPTALRYIWKIAQAVEYMHAKAMNHLDLKPANIMLRDTDNEPVLIDFGLAKQYDATGDQTSTTPVGISHGYAPIEQYRPGGVASFTPQTDIYALGATLYALLSGTTPPHYSDILEDGLPALPASVSSQTMAAIEKAMEIKKNKRPASINEFINDLDAKPDEENLKQNNTESAKGKPVFKNETSAHQSKKETSKIVEATMIIGEGDQIKENSTSDSNHTIIDNIEFVDLGLSVKWAKRFENTQNSRQLASGLDMQIIQATYPKSVDRFIPTKDHFEELFSLCEWKPRKLGRVYIGYDVIGPNGNSIYLPFLPIQTKEQRIPKEKWRELAKEIYVLTREEFDNPSTSLKVLISGSDIRFSTTSVELPMQIRFIKYPH